MEIERKGTGLILSYAGSSLAEEGLDKVLPDADPPGGAHFLQGENPFLFRNPHLFFRVFYHIQLNDNRKRRVSPVKRPPERVLGAVMIDW